MSVTRVSARTRLRLRPRPRPPGPGDGPTRTVRRRVAARGAVAAARLDPGPDPAGSGTGRLVGTGAAVVAGAALVVAAYAWTGGAPTARTALFWSGQLIAFAAVAVRLLGVRATVVERVGLVALYAVAQSVVKVAYSPYRFEFGDELQHWTTATDLVDSGHLQPNFGLPISPDFPVLEDVTAAVVQIGHASVFSAGLIVASMAHLVLALAALALFTRASGSTRVGSVAALVYATNPHQAYINTAFVYEAVAIPLVVVVLWLLVDSRARAVPVTVLLLVTVTVAHHVTSYITIGLLVALTAGFAVLHAPRRVVRTCGAMAVVMAALVVAWTEVGARQVTSYLASPVQDLVSGGGAETSGQVVSSPVPGPVDTALAYLGVLVVLACIPVALTAAWARRPPAAWVLLTVLGCTYLPVLALRVVSSDGQELAGRSLTYVFLGVGPVVAGAVVPLWDRRPGRRATGRRVVAAGLLCTLLGAAVATGWPPSWERLPGDHHVAGFESSLDAQSYQAALWARASLPVSSRVLADSGNASTLTTYGDQRGTDGIPDVFYAPRWDAGIVERLRAQDISYLLVDRRMSTERPVTGLFFKVAPSTGDPSRPIPVAALQKFASVPGISRVYDNGDIAIYDVSAAVFGG